MVQQVSLKIFLCALATHRVVDALPRAYEACQGKVAGATCMVAGALPGSERTGSCIELLPSERGCNSATEDSELNATLACISCDASSRSFGRMDQWAIFACGAIIGSLLTTAMCMVVLKYRKSLDYAREMRSNPSRDRRSIEAREDLSEVQVDVDEGPQGSRKRRQGSKDKPKSPRRKKRSGEARSEEGPASSVAPSSIGSDDERQPRSKGGSRPPSSVASSGIGSDDEKQLRSKSGPKPPSGVAPNSAGSDDDKPPRGKSAPRPKGGPRPESAHEGSDGEKKENGKHQENSKHQGSSERGEGEVGRHRPSKKSDKTSGSQVRQQGKGTPASHQQETLDETLEGLSAQIDSLPMSEVSDALNGTPRKPQPVAPAAAPKTVVPTTPSKASQKAKANCANNIPLEENVKQAKWDQMQADLDLAVHEDGQQAGLRVAPKL